MSMNVINIYYRKSNTPPEVMLNIVEYSIEEGILITLDTDELKTFTPMDLVERLEVCEEAEEVGINE